MMNMFNEVKNYQINFTITWNPNKFSDSDTLWDGPQFFAKYIRGVKYIKRTEFTMEVCPGKITRKHIHGICYLEIPVNNALKRFDIITNISKWCNAKCGNSKFTWNNAEWHTDTDYKTYWQYCLKENPSHYYVVYRCTEDADNTSVVNRPLIEAILL